MVISRCSFADDGKYNWEMKNALAGRANLLFFPTKYANLSPLSLLKAKAAATRASFVSRRSCDFFQIFTVACARRWLHLSQILATN